MKNKALNYTIYTLLKNTGFIILWYSMIVQPQYWVLLGCITIILMYASNKMADRLIKLRDEAV